jgi:hypothetical protein
VIVVGAGEGVRPGEAAAGGAGPAAERELEAALLEVERLVADGTARGDAARRVAAATGIPRRRLYEPRRGR